MKKCEICGMEEQRGNDQTSIPAKILHICENCQNDRKLDMYDGIV